MARIRHHRNPLAIRGPSIGDHDAPLVAAGEHAVEVELGCAEGWWLLGRAALPPAARDCNRFIGVEIRGELIRELNHEAAKRGLGRTVAGFQANLLESLERLFPPSSVRRFVVNFPDPWFKRRHHKRRLMNEKVVEQLIDQLEPKGEIFFQSDVFDLALDAMAVLEGATPALVNASEPWSFCRENPFGATSRREDHSTRRARPIWRLRYIRN